MTRYKHKFSRIWAWLIALILTLGFSTNAMAQMAVKLSDDDVENIIRRSYQYVAMFNVNQKFALDSGSAGLFTDGFNKPVAATVLADDTMQSIPRPNNDTLYQVVVLDLRDDAIIIEYPAIDSQYVVLETSGYDHYAGVPLASSAGDFKKPVKILFYTDRTDGYQGQDVEGIDQIIKTDGDIFTAFLRAMPHQADPERMANIVISLKSVNVVTLSEYLGKPAKGTSELNPPDYGNSDGDVFANNLLEVMQFVFNHTSFDANNAMDQAVLAAYKPLGVEPGKVFDASKVANIDGERFRKAAAEIAANALVAMTDNAVLAHIAPQMFMPKGQIDLETEVIQSVVGPIGLPGYQARYIPVSTTTGEPMNAQHDYVLKMSKDELPPSTAFWSLTLYDLENGFFIPNEQKKYSVGENAGFKLNADGGIEIYVSAKKPSGVPAENWLPINRVDIGMDGMFRIYSPDVEKMKTWNTPKFKMLPPAG